MKLHETVKFFYFYAMKNLILILLFMGSFLAKSQYLIEDNDITENVRDVVKQTIALDLNAPLEFYRLKCENPMYAQFPQGENSFKQVLSKNIQNDLNSGLYSVNGTFELQLNLNKSGNLQSFKLLPDVQNSNLLYRDVELALRRMNPKFKAATCNGVPIESKLRLKINFRTDSFDL